MVSAILTGPTASGKTALAIALAHKRGGVEIINADSMLVYRGMDIGTAKPPPEERAGIPHHLIDVRDPDQSYTAGDFRADVLSALEAIHARGRRALIVGGSGFYLKALLYGLWEGGKADPTIRARLETETSQALHSRLRARDHDSAVRIGPNDRYRLIRALELLETTGKTPTELQREHPTAPDPRFALWIVDRDAAELRERIAARTDAMLAAGLIEEVRGIRDRFPGSRALSAVGYRQVCGWIEGVAPEGAPQESLREAIALATRQLVKTQRTWFRSQKQARWFLLDADRTSLATAFQEIYR